MPIKVCGHFWITGVVMNLFEPMVIFVQYADTVLSLDPSILGVTLPVQDGGTRGDELGRFGFTGTLPVGEQYQIELRIPPGPTAPKFPQFFRSAQLKTQDGTIYLFTATGNNTGYFGTEPNRVKIVG